MRRFIAGILYAFADLLDPPAEPIQSLVWQPGQGNLSTETWNILKGGWEMPDPPSYLPTTCIPAASRRPYGWSCFWTDDWGMALSNIPYPFIDGSRPDESDFEALGFVVIE